MKGCSGMRRLSLMLIVCLLSAMLPAGLAEALENVEFEAPVREASGASGESDLPMENGTDSNGAGEYVLLEDSDDEPEAGREVMAPVEAGDDGDMAIEALPLDEAPDFEIDAAQGEGETQPVQPAMASAPHVDPDGPQLSSNEITLGAGEGFALNPSMPAGLEDAISCISADTAVAEVSAEGVVTAIAPGDTVITATAQGGTWAECLVHVKKAPDKITAKALQTDLGVGESVGISCELPRDTASQLIFESLNADVLTVDATTGVMQGVSVGEAKVRVSTFNGKTATVKVSVHPAPQSISFDVEAVRLGVGMKQSLRAKLNDGAAGGIAYSLQGADVASFDGTTIEGLSKGETLLTATTYNGLTAQCAVAVLDAPTKVTLPWKTLNIGVKQKYTLRPDVGDSASTFTYSTSNKKIVKVSASGVLTGVKTGSATITVKTYNKKSFKLKVNVVKAPGSVGIEPKSAELGAGETVQLSPVFPAKTASGVTFSSSNKAVATVDADTGLVTAVGPGTAKITVKTSNGKKAAASITVSALPEWIQADTDFVQLAVGQSVPLKFTLSPESRCAISYSSQDAGIAAIDGEGVVKGKAPGQTLVVADTGVPGVLSQVSVTVLPAPDSVSLEAVELTLNAGETTKLAPVIPEGTFTAFTYESSNADVATVSDDGAVVAVSKGTAALTVKTHNGLKAQLKLTVLDPFYPDKVTLKNAPKTIKIGEKVQLDWETKPKDAIAGLQWSTSDEYVATVDEAGVLRGVGYGYATVTAVSTRNKSISLEFEVGVGIGDVVLEIPRRTTDIAGIPDNLAKIEAIHVSVIDQIEALEARGVISGSDAKKRRSIVNNAFKDYAFPWMTPTLQKYWKAANSEGGVKDFKPDRVYYGMPYISGGGSNREYNVAKALKENRYTDTGKGYYMLNRKNLRSGKYCGNDCSCFVDAAIWGTNSSHSNDRTSDIASSSSYKTIKGFDSMRPGDLICKGYAHVVMFLYYTDSSKEEIMIIENGGSEPGTNTVHCIIMKVKYYKNRSYKVRRLKSLG